MTHPIQALPHDKGCPCYISRNWENARDETHCNCSRAELMAQWGTMTAIIKYDDGAIIAMSERLYDQDIIIRGIEDPAMPHSRRVAELRDERDILGRTLDKRDKLIAELETAIREHERHSIIHGHSADFDRVLWQALEKGNE